MRPDWIKIILLSLFAAAGCTTIHARTASQDTLLETVRKIEHRSNGQLGIAIHDTGLDRHWYYKADERFPLSSTFKPFACAGLLSKMDKGEEHLDRRLIVHSEDIVTYSPVTANHIGPPGLSLSQLCEATITLSDNTAGNFVLKALGGPTGFTAYMQSIGDKTTRLDRWETALNEAHPGDARDTTTPRAAMTSLTTLLLGEALSPASRDRLTGWMRNDKVADALLRASLPQNWEIADKTGAGNNGSRGIIAVIWPPAQAPLIVAIYMTGTSFSLEERNTAIAEIGHALGRERAH